MADFFLEYGMFLLKTLTIVAAVAAVVILVVSMIMRSRESRRDHIEIKRLNDHYRDAERALKEAILSRAELKLLDKEIKQQHKQVEKHGSPNKKRVYVLDFDGDMRASAVTSLREEITAILTVAGENDEVFVRLHSGGGAVHSYGLAASQLARVKQRGVRLVVSVDKIAASGGYMMACVADHIIAAPFAILGSIGVVAQIPNIHRLLKKHDVDVELITAGEHKRTLTVLGENTDKAREKFRQEMEEIHTLFKDHVKANRAAVDIEQIATGEYWLGTRAHELKLADELKTSDDYLFERSKDSDIFEIQYHEHKGMRQRFGGWVKSLIESRSWFDVGVK